VDTGPALTRPALRRGDLDWNEGRLVIGKGDRQALVVRGASAALKDYRRRAVLDGALATAGFASRLRPPRQGRRRQVKPITVTGRNIVA
jgi:hypothetical protein